VAITVHRGDALEQLRALPDHCAHSLVTDPPAGIGFMGMAWDGDKGGRAQWIAWLAAILAESRRVLRPGAWALVWALPRTSHWTATALEDAGFEVRDVIVHLFGQGFPKSLDVSKAVDKAAGAQREVVGRVVYGDGDGRVRNTAKSIGFGGCDPAADQRTVTAPATDAARQWSGWGTALKPAAEHWILARAPLAGTVAANVLAHGTGALNIDGCRIESVERPLIVSDRSNGSLGNSYSGGPTGELCGSRNAGTTSTGRWPANVVLSGEAIELLDAQSGARHRAAAAPERIALESGGASRFFYCAKASRAERGKGNAHPTVKPLDLMRWLVRLVTPAGGTVLDPFAGSGTTGVACVAEGCFDFLGIEREGEHAEVAIRRAQALDPLFWQEPAPAPAPTTVEARAHSTAQTGSLFGASPTSPTR
jgi:hypothetical protein